MEKEKALLRLGQYQGIIGAIIGDTYGSAYEFEKGPKTPKEKIRIFDYSTFTDDSVLTAAIADYLYRHEHGDPTKPERVIMEWARRFPDAGYGSFFYVNYIEGNNPVPYNSFGNGSAMRISAVPYFARSIEECKALSMTVTATTHNHPEGMKGAEVIAVATYMALHGASKKEIEEYAKSQYDLDLDYERMVNYLGHGQEICQVTVPQALWVFLHSESFEDCLRLAIHIRWDADTLASIACTIAEAFYKEIPEDLYLETIKRLDPRIKVAMEKVPTDR